MRWKEWRRVLGEIHEIKLKSGKEGEVTYLIRVKEFRIKVQDTFQVKSLDIEELLRCDLGVHAAKDRRGGVQLADLHFNLLEFGLIGQVSLVQKHLIGKAYLLHRLVFDSFGLLLGKPVEDHFCVNNSDDRIQRVQGRNVYKDCTQFSESWRGTYDKVCSD